MCYNTNRWFTIYEFRGGKDNNEIYIPGRNSCHFADMLANRN